MKTFKEFLEENRSKDTVYYVDDNPQWDNTLVSYGHKRGYEPVYAVGVGAKELILFELNDYDKKYFSNVKLKSGENLYVYASYTTMSGAMLPLVKFNYNRGMIYHLTDESVNGDDDKDVKFETRGEKMRYVRSLSKPWR